MRPLLLTALLLLPSAAVAGDACQGIALAHGSVNLGVRLPVSKDLGTVDRCLTEVGQTLSQRSGLRTVTVSVRVPDAERVEGNALSIGEAYVEKLVAAGVRRSRISTVAPAGRPGVQGEVLVTFTERKASQPIGIAESVGGPVSAGPSLSELVPLEGGAMLPAGTWIKTELEGRVMIGLADGSRVRLEPRTEIQLVTVHLNEDLKRVVQIEVASGHMETHAAPGGDGSSFDVSTRTGVAGVRGTEFRVHYGAEGMELETLTGLVGLAPEGQEEVEVPAGMRSSISRDGIIAVPTRMLYEPVINSPIKGSVARGAELSWGKVPAANNYVVDLARDAEFTVGARSEQAWKNKFELPEDLAEGRWYWRVTPQDRLGHAGMPSRVHGFLQER